MTSPRSEPVSARRRIVSIIDRALAAFGLIRINKARVEFKTTRRPNPIVQLTSRHNKYRFAYARILNALNLYNGEPEDIKAPNDITAMRIAKAVRRVVGPRRLIIGQKPPIQPVVVSVLDAVRATVKAGEPMAARGFAIDMLESGEMIGSYGNGIALIRLSLWERAYKSLNAYGRTRALQFVPDEYLHAASQVDKPEAIAAAGELIASKGELAADKLDANRWLRLAERLIMLKANDLVAASLELAESAEGADDYADQVEYLRNWLAIEAEKPTVPAGAISIGIVDYKQPLFDKTSSNLGDHVQTLSSMGHLVRHANLQFSGKPELVGLADKLAARVKPERAITDSAAAQANLVLVQRDGSDLQQIPEQTWMVTFGWYAQYRPDMTYGMPLNPNIRPIFVSVHINHLSLLTPETIAYLRKYAPIGCRDWNTVHLLHAAGIPAFFSGCITTTVDTLFAGAPGARGHGDMFVDTKPTGDGEFWKQVRPEVRTDPFVTNMNNALAKLESYRDYYDHVYTSRLHCYLPARSIGADVTFITKKESDPRFDGLIGIDDVAYEKVRQGILTKLDAVYRVILSGASEEEVYKRWAEVTADDVAFAQQAREAINAKPLEQVVDIAHVIHSAENLTKHYPRSIEGVGGEVNVELSLDGNFKTQMLTMVQAILDNTKRPVHFWVLARDHSEADYELAARLFPRASFTWIPTDEIDHGTISSMISHITVATMDRLLLPLLLPNEKRVLHLDLDALAVGDVGELFDIDLHGAAIAAREAQGDQLQSGFAEVRSIAAGLPADRARELVGRSHAIRKFDYDVFNAGVMVLDLEKMRADDFVGTYLPFASAFGMHDQNVLNLYSGGTFTRFGYEWNNLARDESIAGGKFIHWAGSRKPWGSLPVRGQDLWIAARDELLARLTPEEIENVGVPVATPVTAL